MDCQTVIKRLQATGTDNSFFAIATEIEDRLDITGPTEGFGLTLPPLQDTPKQPTLCGLVLFDMEKNYERCRIRLLCSVDPEVSASILEKMVQWARDTGKQVVVDADADVQVTPISVSPLDPNRQFPPPTYMDMERLDIDTDIDMGTFPPRTDSSGEGKEDSMFPPPPDSSGEGKDFDDIDPLAGMSSPRRYPTVSLPPFPGVERRVLKVGDKVEVFWRGKYKGKNYATWWDALITSPSNKNLYNGEVAVDDNGTYSVVFQVGKSRELENNVPQARIRDVLL